MGSPGKQHTFVETESVRYVYQPMEKLYMLLITTKASNILEDLETLRLFARVIPEYCKAMEEREIVDQAFPLIFAFDEIVALGYRENVNLAQIRTFTEMDSHEEEVSKVVTHTKVMETRDHMKRKVKELQRQRQDAVKYGRKVGGMGGFGSDSTGRPPDNAGFIQTSVESTPAKPSYTPASKAAAPSGGRGMKLGSKAKDVDSFVDQLKSEGQQVVSATMSSKAGAISKSATPAVNQESVHIRTEEKICLTAGRDGGLQNLEIHGLVRLRISDDQFSRIAIAIANEDTKGIQLQTHPNVNKKLFAEQSILSLKNPAKPFPLKQEVGVLKWRFQTQDDSFMPLSINCWPNETAEGCDVNIEYELERTDMELNDVLISIPIPSGVGSPTVTDCDGDYTYESRKSCLQWSLPVIDESNKSGAMEFSVNGHPDDFFPVTVSFVSKKLYCDLEVTSAKNIDDNSPIKYSSEVIFFVDKYEIV
ncbi:hypothetical protein CAPTEDRAFT_140383 [Capitella teleta]|uniref:Coatomer subunit delta n=1 Tax=Capitella teleta TaxID=283909 RepID=R7T3W8_CAPTE|nr:hypothetical protein CAPTEDRAFT_140383 [Capitella teleta]|eukprot:ELT87396.1 hypothetical protein CAPTEDRAFT_140383 [Capitella teleta]